MLSFFLPFLLSISSRVISESPSSVPGNDSILFPSKEKRCPAQNKSLGTLRGVCLREMISDFVFLSLRFANRDVINELSAATCLFESDNPKWKVFIKMPFHRWSSSDCFNQFSQVLSLFPSPFTPSLDDSLIEPNHSSDATLSGEDHSVTAFYLKPKARHIPLKIMARTWAKR